MLLFCNNFIPLYEIFQAGLNWDDIDSFGNNCVHLAASGGNLQVF